jgi:hypothetical protein
MPAIPEGEIKVCQAVGQIWEGSKQEGLFWVTDSFPERPGEYVNDRGDGQSFAFWFESKEAAEEAAKLYSKKHRTKDWHQQLVSLVGDCIVHHENGFDVLASDCWDRVVELWGAASRD